MQTLPALLAVLTGFLWGGTNPLVKRGSEVAEAAQASREKEFGPRGRGYRGRGASIAYVLRSWGHLLWTPAFIVPQVLNLCGSVLFAATLGLASGDLHTTVTLANGVSLLANAAVDAAVGGEQNLKLVLPGGALVLIGVTLCALP